MTEYVKNLEFSFDDILRSIIRLDTEYQYKLSQGIIGERITGDMLKRTTELNIKMGTLSMDDKERLAERLGERVNNLPNGTTSAIIGAFYDAINYYVPCKRKAQRLNGRY